MPRVQVQDPLPSSPRLQPTSCPLAIGGAARPAPRPQDNGILALADALSEWQPVLRQLVADRATTAAEAAVTEGELKAAELSAKERMGVLNAGLKAYADKGEIPVSQLPFFRQGFSRRAGQELALSELPAALDARLADASKLEDRAEPEAVLEETLKAFRERLPAGDIFAQQGFDKQAQRIADSFRQKAAATYAQNYEAAGRLRIANEATGILAQFADADIDSKDAVRAQFRQFFDGVKAEELPKHEVAPFLVERAVAPLVRDLASRGSFDDAEDVLEELESFDITGQGGLLGATATGRASFSVLRNQIAQARDAADDPAEVLAKKVRDSQLRGTSAAKAAVVALGAERMTYTTRETLAAKFREEHKDDPDAIFAFQDFLDGQIRQGPRPDDDGMVAGLSRLMDTTNTEQLSRATEQLAEASRAGLISPATELKLEREINRRRSLVGLITDEDSKLAERLIYRAEADDLSGKVLPAFASAVAYGSEALTPAQRLQHRQQTMQVYRDTLATKLRGGGFKNADEAQAELPRLRAESITEALAYADQLTASFLPKPSPGAGTATAPEKPKPAGRGFTKEAADAVVSPATETTDNERNRAAFFSFFAEPFQGSGTDWKISDAALEGQIAKLTSKPGDGPLTPLSFASSAEINEAKERLRPVLLYRSVSDSYYALVRYRERGSDAGDPNYIKRLREFAVNLKTHGGAEYMTPEQLTQIGLKPEAFPTAGTRAGLIR